MEVQESNFKLRASHSTDIWRKPPHTNVFSTPGQMLPPIPIREFSRARVTFKGIWEYQYDQAGILLCFSGLNPGSPHNNDPTRNPWIKAGVEFYNGVPRISFVGCDRYADWSLHHVESGQTAMLDHKTTDYVTIELRRERDENGNALWAYQLLLDDQGEVVEKYPIRECTWAFANEDYQIQVGAYAARPATATTPDSRELEVDFRDLTLRRL